MLLSMSCADPSQAMLNFTLEFILHFINRILDGLLGYTLFYLRTTRTFEMRIASGNNGSPNL